MTLDLEDLGMTIDETTRNATRFLNFVHERGGEVKALREYVPPAGKARYVKDMPLYAPDTRLYEHDEEPVALGDYTQPDGTPARRW
jgi:hypothetical protein